MIWFERFLPACSLWPVSKLAKTIAMLTLALWGLAAMHCTLEGVPGFGFLKSCCFVDSAPAAPQDCEDDGCGEVEDGQYRSEEQTVSAPVPLLVLSFLLPVWEATAPPARPQPVLPSGSPPELPRAWQFSYRTALPPRAPSLVA